MSSNPATPISAPRVAERRIARREVVAVEAKGPHLQIPEGLCRPAEDLIDASEATVSDGHARLVTIVGEAGSSKSRLLWESFESVDRIEDVRWWHQGRCLAYGEGVAHWALAEMVVVGRVPELHPRSRPARAAHRAALSAG